MKFQGGLGTREEMCISALVYYPRIDLGFSVSQITESEYHDFLRTTKYVTQNLKKAIMLKFRALANDLVLVFRPGQQILNNEVEYVEGLNAIDWDSNNLRTTFQNTLDNGTQDVLCGKDLVSLHKT